MLHELIFALAGYPSDIFSVEDKENSIEHNIHEISKRVPFLTPSEISVILQLLQIGEDFVNLNKFIEKYTIPGLSLYLTAFANSIDDVLGGYRETVANIESELLHDSSLGLAHIQHRLSNYKPQLKFINTLVYNVKSSLISNCELKNEIRSSCKMLDAVSQTDFFTILGCRNILRYVEYSLIRVLSFQLSAWLLEGRICDPLKEFFVYSYFDDVDKNSPMIKDNLPDETQSMPDKISQLDIASNVERFEDNATRFELNVNYVPSFMPLSVASQILKCGEAVYSLSKVETKDPFNTKPSFCEELQEKFSARFKDFIELKNFNSSQTIFVDLDESVFSARTEDLLLLLIKDVCNFIMEQTWSQMFNDYGLIYHLTLIKDIFLIGRGELFLLFLDNLRHLDVEPQEYHQFRKLSNKHLSLHKVLLDRPPPSDTNEAKDIAHDINEAFLSAVRAIGLNDENIAKHYKFALSTFALETPKLQDEHICSPTAWDCLRLEYKAPSGLQSIFTENVCKAYDRIFSLLIAVRRSEQALSQYWALVTSRTRHLRHLVPTKMEIGNRLCPLNEEKCQELNENLSQRMLLHNQMAFFVNNLSCYLQVDVIAPQFRHLLIGLQKRDFGASVEALHEAYLAGLQAQAFLFHPTIRPLLLRLLNLCRGFVYGSRLPETSGLAEGDVGHQTRCQLAEFGAQFRRLARELFHCLSTAQQMSSRGVGLGLEDSHSLDGGHLARLLIRLDFNHFFSHLTQQ